MQFELGFSAGVVWRHEQRTRIVRLMKGKTLNSSLGKPKSALGRRRVIFRPAKNPRQQPGGAMSKCGGRSACEGSTRVRHTDDGYSND